MLLELPGPSFAHPWVPSGAGLSRDAISGGTDIEPSSHCIWHQCYLSAGDRTKGPVGAAGEGKGVLEGPGRGAALDGVSLAPCHDIDAGQDAHLEISLLSLAGLWEPYFSSIDQLSLSPGGNLLHFQAPS